MNCARRLGYLRRFVEWTPDADFLENAYKITCAYLFVFTHTHTHTYSAPIGTRFHCLTQVGPKIAATTHGVMKLLTNTCTASAAAERTHTHLDVSVYCWPTLLLCEFWYPRLPLVSIRKHNGMCAHSHISTQTITFTFFVCKC